MLICELEKFDEAHAEFNAAVIATARAALPGIPVCFLASTVHAAAVQNELKRYRIINVSFKQLPVPPKGGKIRKHWYLITTVRLVFGLFRKMKCSHLLVSGLHQKLHPYLLLLIPRKFEGHCCAIAHRGHYLAPKAQVTRRDWLRNKVIRFFADKKLKVVVLAPTVAQYLNANSIESRLDIQWIYHPYLLDDETEPTELTTKPVHFAFLGRTSKGKGFDIFCGLANDISQTISSRDVEFTLIGRLQWLPKEYSANGAVRLAGSGGRISRDELADHLQKVSYLVIPYMTTVYGKIKTTGIFFDSVKYLKPIIALKSDDLAHYFTLFGDLGVLCESVEEMKHVLLQIIHYPPKKDYAEQQARLLKARHFLHHEHQKEAFRALWD